MREGSPLELELQATASLQRNSSPLDEQQLVLASEPFLGLQPTPPYPQLDFLKKLLLLKTYVPRKLRGLAQGLISILHQPRSPKVLGDFPKPSKGPLSASAKRRGGLGTFRTRWCNSGQSLPAESSALPRTPCVMVNVSGGLGLKHQDQCMKEGSLQRKPTSLALCLRSGVCVCWGMCSNGSGGTFEIQTREAEAGL